MTLIIVPSNFVFLIARWRTARKLTSALQWFLGSWSTNKKWVWLLSKHVLSFLKLLDISYSTVRPATFNLLRSVTISHGVMPIQTPLFSSWLAWPSSKTSPTYLMTPALTPSVITQALVERTTYKISIP